MSTTPVIANLTNKTPIVLHHPIPNPILWPIVLETVPQISSISPSPRGPGQSVTVYGSNFGATRGNGYLKFSNGNVSWGAPGNQAAFQVISWSNTQITFMVPEPSGPSNEWAIQADSTATITVTDNAGQTSAAAYLPVTLAPVISSLSVSQAPPGTVVTVNGNYFGATQGAGYVRCQCNNISSGAPGNSGGVQINSWSDSQITFVIPEGSATTIGTTASITLANATGLTSNSESILITTNVQWPVSASSGNQQIGTSGNGHIQTTVSISQNGTVSATTTISDSSGWGFLTGFHAGVGIVIVGPYKNILQEFSNVFGAQGGQTYTASWGGQLTASSLAQVWGIAINQAYDAEGTGAIISNWFTQIGSDYNDVSSLVQEVGTLTSSGSSSGS
jgi:hypothetical protein